MDGPVHRKEGVAVPSDWYCRLDDTVVGPFTPGELRDRVREGRLKRESLLRRGQSGEWVHARRLTGLFNEAGDDPAQRRDPSNHPVTLVAPRRTHFACPQCGKDLNAQVEHAGRQVKCPVCGERMIVPNGQPAGGPTSPDPPAGRNPTRRPLDGKSFGKPAIDHPGTERLPPLVAMAGGIVLMTIAGVWFLIGLQFDYIFYFPPFLALMGLASFLQGLLTAMFNLIKRAFAAPSRRVRDS